MVAAVVREKGTITIRNLGQMGPQFLEQEVYKTVSRTAVEETKKQIRLDNPPSRIRINRKRSVDITPAMLKAISTLGPSSERVFGEARNVRIFFTDMSVLIDAVKAAYRSLERKIPKRGGHAWRSVYFWLNDPQEPSRNRKAQTLQSVVSWLEASSNQRVNVRILGPTIEYRRSVIYRSGRVRQRSKWVGAKRGLSPGKATDRYRFTARFKGLDPSRRTKLTDRIGVKSSRRGFKVRVGKAVNDTVRDEIRRQFRDISVGYGFTRSRERLPIIDPNWEPTGQNIHIPEISLGIKKR